MEHEAPTKIGVSQRLDSTEAAALASNQIMHEYVPSMPAYGTISIVLSLRTGDLAAQVTPPDPSCQNPNVEHRATEHRHDYGAHRDEKRKQAVSQPAPQHAGLPYRARQSPEQD